MKVSVIIPAYQSEVYLERCLNSVLNQTLKDFEVIIVNDGSTDRTQAIIDKYGQTFENIHSIFQSNQGIIRAKERALREVKGEYVLMIDHDDWIDPKTLEILYNKAIKENADIVFFNYIQVAGDKGYLKQRFDKKISGDLVEIARKTCPNWAKLVKTSHIKKVRYEEIPSITYWEDVPSALTLMLYNPKMAYVEDYLYYWNNNTASVSSAIKDHYAADIMLAYHFVVRRFKEEGLYEQYKSKLFELLEVTNNQFNEIKDRYPICAKQISEFCKQTQHELLKSEY